MKLKGLYILAMTIVISCSGQKEFSKAVFLHDEPTENGHVKRKYSLQVPKGYELEKIKAGGEIGQEDRYVYSDSSMFYVSTFEGTPNEESIINQEGAKSKKYMALAEDTDLTLEGNNKGKYWKEVILKNGIRLGYKGVTDKRKSDFENAVQSFKLK